MIVTIHGEAVNGRAVGRPRTLTAAGLSSRDPVVAARLARSVVQAGEWRTLPARSEQNRILMAIAAKAQWAVRALTADMVGVLPAVGKEKPPGGCDWCAALVQRSPEPELDHHDPVNLAALGNPCDGCQRRWAAAEAEAAVAKREGADIKQIAAGGSLVAAADGMGRARRALSRSQPAPTGAIRATSKPPPPSYYIQGRPR